MANPYDPPTSSSDSPEGRLAAKTRRRKLILLLLLNGVATILIGAFCLYMSQSASRTVHYMWLCSWPVLTLAFAGGVRMLTGLPALSALSLMWGILVTVLAAFPMHYVLFPPKHDQFGGYGYGMYSLNVLLCYIVPVIAVASIFLLRADRKGSMWYKIVGGIYILSGLLLVAARICFSQ